MTAVLYPDFRDFPDFSDLAELEVRLGNARPQHSVYVRRRLVAALLALGLLIGVGASVQAALADRGGVPASIPAIRSATVAAASGLTAAPVPTPATVPTAPVAVQYIVQPGDTLWSLADRFHGTHGLSGYVDSLVQANGGATVRPGQLISLP